MNSYLKRIGRTLTIWLLASLINGFLCGISLSIIYTIYSKLAAEIVGVTFISLFFSAPDFFIFWLILLFKISTYTTERALFRSALITGFILASVTAYFGSKIFSYEFDNHSSIPAACIIISAMGSIMVHFKQFKKIK
jgi:hypothetical protein